MLRRSATGREGEVEVRQRGFVCQAKAEKEKYEREAKDHRRLGGANLAFDEGTNYAQVLASGTVQMKSQMQCMIDGKHRDGHKEDCQQTSESCFCPTARTGGSSFQLHLSGPKEAYALEMRKPPGKRILRD